MIKMLQKMTNTINNHITKFLEIATHKKEKKKEIKKKKICTCPPQTIKILNNFFF